MQKYEVKAKAGASYFFCHIATERAGSSNQDSDIVERWRMGYSLGYTIRNTTADDIWVALDGFDNFDRGIYVLAEDNHLSPSRKSRVRFFVYIFGYRLYETIKAIGVERKAYTR